MSDSNQAVETIFKILERQRNSGIPKEELETLKKEYTQAWEDAELKSKDAKLKDTEKANYTKVFKALPDLAKGAKAAAEAFSKGDSLGGAIAMVDICGTAATLLSSVAAASSMMGPAGAAAAAVFAITSMVLKSFEPAQKSMGDIIEEKLRQIKAESKIGSIKTVINAYELHYTGYQDMKDQPLDSGMRSSLAEGNAINDHNKVAEWLSTKQNINADALGGMWVQVLMYYLYANTLLIRNLTHLMSVIRAADRKSLNNSYKSIVKMHLKYLEDLYEPARDKGNIWHIGVNHGLFSSSEGSGGPIFLRLGANGPGPWKKLEGQQTSFTVAKADAEDVHHVVALEGAMKGGIGDYGLPGRHKRAYFKSLGGEWTAEGTEWEELKGLNKCRNVVALPGDQVAQIYVFAIQNNRVTARTVTQAAKIEISDELEADNAAAAGELLLFLSVMPGYRPEAANKSPATLYLLKGPESMERVPGTGLHKIQRGIAKGAWQFAPPWDRVKGMVADASHLWVWSEDKVARMSHEQIGLLASRGAAEDESRKAWEIASLANKETWKGPAMTVDRTKILSGLAHLSSCSDGTLVAAFNMRLYRATPYATTTPGTFGLTWKALDPKVEAVRVLKEPIECWPLFEKLYDTLKKGAKSE